MEVDAAHTDGVLDKIFSISSLSPFVRVSSSASLRFSLLVFAVSAAVSRCLWLFGPAAFYLGFFVSFSLPSFFEPCRPVPPLDGAKVARSLCLAPLPLAPLFAFL